MVTSVPRAQQNIIVRIIVRMTVLPPERHRPVMKSRAMCDQGRPGVVWVLGKPARQELEDLFSVQAGTYVHLCPQFVP